MTVSQLELEDLMHQTLPVAKKMLKDDGALIPYGAVMRPNGEVLPVGVEITQSDLKARDVVEILADNLVDMAQSGDYKATAVFYAVQVSLPGTDQLSEAVAVSLCHMAGESLMVFHPYNRAAGSINYGSAFAYFDENRMFSRLH